MTVVVDDYHCWAIERKFMVEYFSNGKCIHKQKFNNMDSDKIGKAEEKLEDCISYNNAQTENCRKICIWDLVYVMEQLAEN